MKINIANGGGYKYSAANKPINSAGNDKIVFL